MTPIRNIFARAGLSESAPSEASPRKLLSEEHVARPLFRCILAVHTGDRVESDLLEYAAMLASVDVQTSVHVIAVPSSGALHALGPEIRSIFAARGVLDVSPWVLPEPDLDEVFAMVRNLGADLLVLRHPRAFLKGRTLARRLLTEAPCSVCYVPEGAPRRLDRAVAGVSLDMEGSQLLEFAARLCRKAGAEELLAVHACFLESLACDESAGDRFREEAILNLYRLLARTRLHGMQIAPLVEESRCYSRAILNVAREGMADFVVVGEPGRAGVPLLPPSHEAKELLERCEVPLLRVLLSRERTSLTRMLRRRLFSQPEPAFN